MGCANTKKKQPPTSNVKNVNNVQQSNMRGQSRLNQPQMNNGNVNQSNIGQSNIRSDAGRKKSILRSTMKAQPGVVNSENQKPKANPAYSVDSMTAQNQIDASSFNGIRNFQVKNDPWQVRNVVYDQQETGAVRSKMVANNKLLIYDLDTDDGISKTPLVNTFQYKTVLNHNIYLANYGNNNNENQLIRPTSSKIMVSQNKF